MPENSSSSQWTLSEIGSALGVPPRRMLSDWRAAGVSIDSRTLKRGEIFVCVRGERTDGHEYISQALAAGAAALIVEERAALVRDLNLPHPTEPVAVFLVEDGLVALQELARFHRNRMTGRVFGITGSNGKTSAKEMLAGMLSQLPPPAAPPASQTGQPDPTNLTSPEIIGVTNVAATHGNLNNHFGVPLTLLAMPADMQYAVIEMGMNHAGEIELLSRISRPHQALITSIAPVHIENFSDLTGIANAKLEILAGLEPGGSLVFPGEVAAPFKALARQATDASNTRLVLFAAQQIRQASDGLRFEWRGHTVHAPAYHNPVMASNLTAVLELLSAAGFSEVDLVAAAAKIQPRTGRRFEIIQKARGPAKNDSQGAPQLLVDDSYNANPTSFSGAVEALRALLPEGRLACFAGEMGELGPEYGPAGHREVGETLARSGYEFVGVCGGKNAEALKDTFIEKSRPDVHTVAYATVQDLMADLELSDLGRFDGILIKGSRSARMDALCDALRDHSYI